jgi:hypothetical protein
LKPRRVGLEPTVPANVGSFVSVAVAQGAAVEAPPPAHRPPATTRLVAALVARLAFVTPKTRRRAVVAVVPGIAATATLVAGLAFVAQLAGRLIRKRDRSSCACAENECRKENSSSLHALSSP